MGAFPKDVFCAVKVLKDGYTPSSLWHFALDNLVELFAVIESALGELEQILLVDRALVDGVRAASVCAGTTGLHTEQSWSCFGAYAIVRFAVLTEGYVTHFTTSCTF